MCNASFVEAFASYWNPWKCKMELSGLFLLDDPSRNAWTVWTWNKPLPWVEASRKGNPLLHSAQQKFSKPWLKLWCQLAGKLSNSTALFCFFAFLSLFPFSDLFVSMSGLTNPVFAPRQIPTGRSSSPRAPPRTAQTHRMLHWAELSLCSISHHGHRKAKRRQRKDVAVSQKAGFVPHYMGCGRTFISVHPIYTSSEIVFTNTLANSNLQLNSSMCNGFSSPYFC